MATVIPAIKGKLGSTTYYEATMKVADLLSSVSPPTDLDEWAQHGLEEKMQREPNTKRVANELAPYLANNEDRFFGSIIVLIWQGEVEFESISDSPIGKVSSLYKNATKKIGLLTVDGGKLVVLDGQHRYLAMRAVKEGVVKGEYSNDILEDEVCVVMIQHESNMKTRRIFNTVNRHAKQTSRGDNIITSEDDGYAIVARRMLSEDQPFADRTVGGETYELVNWKSNTLTKRSTPLTTLSTVYEATKLILDAEGVPKLSEQSRPTDQDIERYLDMMREVWEPLLEGIMPYKEAIANPKQMPEFRADDAPTSLLFKPASQLALIDALLKVMTQNQGGLQINEAIDRVNKIDDWSMSAGLWKGVIIKQNGTIDAGPEAKRRMASLLVYLLAADKLEDGMKLEIWRGFNAARGNEVDAYLENGGQEGTAEDLPPPVAGAVFTKEEALTTSAKIAAAA